MNASLPPIVPVPAPVVDIVRTLESAGFDAWCVGGALRDAVLGLPHADFDVATSAPPDRVRTLFRRTIAVGERFGTIGVLDHANVLHEVTTFRRDVATDGRHAVVEYGASLDEDLARRDFTINALAYHPLRELWRDPYGAARDLSLRIVRAVGIPAERFREDYLRILRGLRFAARFGFAIEPGTWSAMRQAANGMAGLSAERVRDEWVKGLESAASIGEVVRLWRESGAAAVWLPELRSIDEGLAQRLSARPRDPVLLTVVLCAEPAGVLRRLRSSNAEIARAEELAAAPAAPEGSDEPAVRRWLARLGEHARDALRLHELLHGAPAPWKQRVATIVRRGDPLVRGQLAVGGTELLALGLSGPRIGEALDLLLQRVLDDPALNERETLLSLARQLE